MEEEIEDIIGEIKYTDSQKSVATSNMYSVEYMDSYSENFSSSGKETYILGYDSEDSDKVLNLYDSKSIVNLKDRSTSSSKATGEIQIGTAQRSVQYKPIISNNSASTSYHACSTIAQGTCTQTSKTIIQLAETDGAIRLPTDNITIETQTSFVSVTENKTIEYRIEVTQAHKTFTKSEVLTNMNVLKKSPTFYNITCNQITSDSVGEESSRFPISETDNDFTEDIGSDESLNDRLIKIIDDESNETILSEEEHSGLKYENTSDFEDSVTDTDIEEDSLMRNSCESPLVNVDNDVNELHSKLAEKLHMPDISYNELENNKRHYSTLTPLTEESTIKKESLLNLTSTVEQNPDAIKEFEETEDKDDVVFLNEVGIEVKLYKDNKIKKDKEPFKLPPIQNKSCPSSPHLNNLFSANKANKLTKADTLPCLYTGNRQRESLLDRWEIGTKGLASGESPLIHGRDESSKSARGYTHLPPIHKEAVVNDKTASVKDTTLSINELLKTETVHATEDSISIKEKIKELKIDNTMLMKTWKHTKNNSIARLESRSGSPGSVASPEDSKLCNAAERGCEALCVELLRRLRGFAWMEVLETLEEIPRILSKYWEVITEQRIADIIRQVNAHIESPRPQIARRACTAVASILKNTNYTKKPDFYESVTILLTKTGSYSRPVRRAANVALDEIVCGVDLTQAVTALCIHGVGHKSTLVRCAAARLLVVCCALAGGGRDLLRARPATAATARRLMLRALSALLDDKSTDARKYAERLYAMLRSLANFEAYYLTDVDVELASRQMKKYDQLLLCGPPKETR